MHIWQVVIKDEKYFLIIYTALKIAYIDPVSNLPMHGVGQTTFNATSIA